MRGIDCDLIDILYVMCRIDGSYPVPHSPRCRLEGYDILFAILFMFLFVVLFARMIKYLIWELKSLLFAKEPSMNTKIFIWSKSRAIYFMPLSRFFSCHLRCLFNAWISFSVGFWHCAATDRSYEASG